MSTEVAVPEPTAQQRAIAAFAKCKTEKELIELAAKHVDIVTITNQDGRDQVHAARMVLKNERVFITKYGEKVREEAVQFSKGTIAEQKRLIGLIEPEEMRLEKIQKKWDDAEEAKKQAAILAEQERMAVLQERVRELSGLLGVLKRHNPSAETIAEHIADLEAVPVDDSFQEFRAEAEAAKAETLKFARDMLCVTAEREAEKRRLKEEREELDRQRAEQKKIDDAAKAERDAETARQNEAIRKQKAEQDAETARVAAANAAEAKRLADIAADLGRQQEEIRKAQEPAPPAPQPPSPVSRRGVAVPVPSATEIVDVLSKHYRARPDTILEWLRSVNWSKAEAA